MACPGDTERSARAHENGCRTELDRGNRRGRAGERNAPWLRLPRERECVSGPVLGLLPNIVCILNVRLGGTGGACGTEGARPNETPHGQGDRAVLEVRNFAAAMFATFFALMSQKQSARHRSSP